MKLFTRDNCEFCAQLEIPEGFNLETINVDKGYGGFVPPNVPVLQVNGLNLEGPHVINTIVKAIHDYKG